MSCPELEVPAEQLTNVRLRGYLDKRGSGLVKNWNHRFAVVSSNFLFLYMNEKVRCERR